MLSESHQCELDPVEVLELMELLPASEILQAAAEDPALSSSDVEVLGFLLPRLQLPEHGRRTPASAVARGTGLTPSTAARRLSHLVSQGWLVRTRLRERAQVFGPGPILTACIQVAGDMTPAARLIHSYLAATRDQGPLRINRSRIAAELRLSRVTASAAVQELIDAGLLKEDRARFSLATWWEACRGSTNTSIATNRPKGGNGTVWDRL